MSIKPESIAKRILKHLHAMDMEANTETRGHKTGLYWYGGFTRPNQKKPHTEPHWSKRLAVLMNTDGMQTDTEVYYNDRAGPKCDLVITASDETFWFEIKGAWKEYWYNEGKSRTYESYLLHPFVENLEKKTHTAALDLQRITKLTPAAATWIGLLLVGFDSDQRPMDEDVTKLASLGGIDQIPWYCISSGWPDPYRPSERVRCWVWLKRNVRD